MFSVALSVALAASAPILPASSVTSGAAIAVCFAPEEDCVAVAVRAINNAEREILVGAYGITAGWRTALSICRRRRRGWQLICNEMTTFPNGRHDDQVDSTAQMLDWFKRGSGPTSNAGIFELTRRRAEDARNSQPRPEPLSVMAKRLGILRPL